MQKRLLTFQLLGLLFVTTSTTAQTLTFGNAKLQLTLDYNAKATVSALTVNGEKVIDGPDGIYSEIKTKTTTYSTLHLLATPVAAKTGNTVNITNIVYGDQDLTISETWHFIITNDNIKFNIDRTLSKPVQIEEASLPIFTFKNIDTWEGAYQDYGGLAWFYLFNKRSETYGVHSQSSKFWNSKTNNGLTVTVDAHGKQVAMSYSRTMTDQLAYRITVAQNEILPRFDSGTNRRRFLRDSTNIWAPIQAKPGTTTQSITLSYFDFNKTYGRGQLTGINGDQVSAVLNTIARIGVIDKQHFGGNSWHTPYGPICLHEQYIGQLGLAINDPDYLKGYQQCLDFYRDNAIKPDGRVWPRWAYSNEDAMPGAFTDKGFYEAQWGYLLDANPDLVTNVAELYDQTGDLPWVKTHQSSCEKALDWICKRDSNDNGLVEMITDSHEQKRGSDWIDIIWASYENAFVNAKLYHALVLWAAIENRLDNPDKATYYHNFAQKLKASFNKSIDQGGFWDEKNSCYVHWREKDGSIHGDNMVTPVNFMAIGYGICDDTLRRNAILDKIEAQMQKEKLFFWPLCLSTYQKGDGNDWQFPFPNYENGDIFLSWGALGVKAYADYKPEIALQYVKNVLAQYAKDGLAFQRYGRTKQDGLGDDILAGNSLSVVGLYQAIYGINPLYNRLYLNPHLTKELAGTKLNYNFRGQKLTVDLNPNQYKIANNQFSIASTKDFGFYADKDTLMYFDRASNKPNLRIEANANLSLDIKTWTPDRIRWNQSSTGRQVYHLNNLLANSRYTLSTNNKPYKQLHTNATGELQFDYTGNNPEFSLESSAITQLKANFLSPPDSTRPGVYWYFMDGNRSAQSMTEDLEAMKKAGIGSVIFLEVNVGIPRGKVDFFSRQWQDLFTHAVREAERLGIQITLGIGPGWTGSGGPWVTPEQSMQHLVCSTTQITENTNAKPIILPVPPPKKPYFGEDGLTPELKRQWEKFYTDVAVLAFPTPPRAKKIEDIDEKALYYRAPFSSAPGVKPYLPAIASYDSLPADEIIDRKQLIDLTSKLHPDGSLDWKAPPGNWTILRFVARNNGAVTRPAPYPGLGFESDKMDTAALDAHLDHYVGALIRRIGIPDPNNAGGLKRLHMDSWEMGAQNWTPNFRNEFIKRRGYDPLPYYPVYNGDIIGSVQQSEQFLWDLRQTAQELVLDYHARHLKAFAHKNNLRLSIEPYDMNPTADLELGSVADIPMAEFWSNGFGFNSSFSVIEATSIGHVNGISLIQAEAFTAQDNESWKQYPGSMKEQGDWAFAAGINRFFYHTFQSQTLPDSLKPGMTMGPYGVHWDRNQTWWPLVKNYHTYISRCQYILQQGRPVADILYLTPEGAPQVFQPPYSALTGEEPIRDRRGYNFDGCSPSQLKSATVINNNIVFPGGATYRVIVLPNTPKTTPALAAKIASLKAEGATIISPQAKADSLYPDYESTATLLRQMHLAEDFHADGPLRYTHRTSPDYDIYFVANKTGYDLQTAADFRCTTGRPELWDPITGETSALPEYTRHDQQTTIPLQFAAYESFFIVFNRDTTTNTPQRQTNFPLTTTTATLASSWTVSFDPKWGGPTQITFDSLEDWTRRPEPGIKYYSGIATYKQTFRQSTFPKHTRIYLDLGQVHDLARITLNGHEVGTIWTAPYKVDITTALKQGDNKLQIEVANRWPNRLIGDQQLPDDGIVNNQWPQWLLQGKPRKSARFTFTTYNPYQKESPLLPSGLIGPVTIQEQTIEKPKHKEPKIVNIVNFIRLLEPRDSTITEDVLYQTVVKQLALMRQYRLGGTFLLQYDALLDKRYQTLLRSLPKDSFEIGAWWEIPQPLVERSGMKWRGRYPWDWRANIGFSTGYTPKEREKLIDTYMRDFKNIFGYYPRSVASWFIDAYSLDYMYRKYHIVASANCKDQYGTDGYTLWGGYWNQAYYPSRKNSYMPAQHEQNQIPVPIFRMLGSDPVRQYDNGLGTTRQGVVTLEPVYTFGGGDSTWVNWFLKAFTDDESLDFNYTQAGQENSFTWNAMAKGLDIQLPLIARLRAEGKLKVETLEASGRWFKQHYHTTPATAFTVAKDIDSSTLKTAWFDSRYYRTNLLWENGSLRIRDIHLFNEDLPSTYTTQPATSNECTFFTLPVIDGYLWSKPGQKAGARLMATINGREQLIIGGDPIFSSPDSGTLHITWPLKTVEGTLEIDLNEKQFSTRLRLNTNKQLEWYFQLTTADSAKLPFTRIEPQTLYGRFEGMDYSVKAENGVFSKPKDPSAIRISPQKNKITLDMGQR